MRFQMWKGIMMDRHQYHAVLSRLIEVLLPKWIDYYREATDNAEDAAKRCAAMKTDTISDLVDRQNAEVAANCYEKICCFLEERLQMARRQLMKNPAPLANRKREAERLYDFLIHFLLSAQTWGLCNESPALKSANEQDELIEELKEADYPPEVWGVLEAGRISTILAAQIFREFQQNILNYVKDLQSAIVKGDKDS
jgi:hypothetical protein